MKMRIIRRNFWKFRIWRNYLENFSITPMQVLCKIPLGKFENSKKSKILRFFGFFEIFRNFGKFFGFFEIFRNFGKSC